MMQSGWQLLSSIGNGALLLPLLACTATLLVLQSREGRTAARRWVAATAIAGLAVVASKIAFYGWGTGVRAWNLTSASGHAALALATWPVLLPLLVPPSRPGLRILMLAGGTTLGLACAWSRLALDAHPWPEVLAGVALGGIATAVTMPCIRGLHLTLPRSSLILGLLLALGTWHLIPPINPESWFARAGAWLAGRDAPVSRQAWRNPESL